MTTAPTDTLMHNVGAPAAATGMSRSSFRPSDDATTLPYLVPANAMAVVELRAVAAQLRQLIKTPWGANLAGSRATEVAATATAADALASQIAAGIAASGVVNHPQTKQPVYAYETDGFGNAMHMDDANVPSLLSLPYLGFVNSSDPVYKATRQVVLSNATNPWFFVGGACPMGGTLKRALWSALACVPATALLRRVVACLLSFFFLLFSPLFLFSFLKHIWC